MHTLITTADTSRPQYLETSPSFIYPSFTNRWESCTSLIKFVTYSIPKANGIRVVRCFTRVLFLKNKYKIIYRLVSFRQKIVDQLLCVILIKDYSLVDFDRRCFNFAFILGTYIVRRFLNNDYVELWDALNNFTWYIYSPNVIVFKSDTSRI